MKSRQAVMAKKKRNANFHAYKNLCCDAKVLKYGRYVWFGCRLGQHQMIYILSPPFSSLSPKCFLLSHKRIHSIQDTWFSNTNKTFHSSEQMAKISRGLKIFVILAIIYDFDHTSQLWSDLKIVTRVHNLDSFLQSWPKMVTPKISPGGWVKRKTCCLCRSDLRCL